MSLTKFKYYVTHGLISILPPAVFRYRAKKLLTGSEQKRREEVMSRVDYYNKLTQPFELNNEVQTVKNFKKTGGNTYYFDLLKVIKGFDPENRFSVLNGDIRHIPEQPSFLKSRPITGKNQNCVVLKLNAIRHFQFVDDKLSFRDKKDMVAWRGVGFQPHRQVVIKQFYNHPMCNLGQTRPHEGQPWEKGFMSIEEQLQYKFLLAIEGNDVATNLKWSMSSNSLVLMSKPKYETWFMEGQLLAGHHYVELKNDYSDLPDKVGYFIDHPEEAEAIIRNANKWVEQFKDTKQERLISLLVAQKYFEKSGQSL
ncbi:glycosyl transferase family 90 [Vibrio lentus]|uniref:Lipopolysaccharide A protein n=1 Tax=Vibrio lentus TaxID=136468 RepID=A0AA44VXQ8_9VIBR|nr:glycosyl transferase family 90 [Vibrio lentus]MCB5361827.1 lipopolysaccharide A protein [Vibrio lentus]MCB5447591.1 lipopolysaccharide A protein [Vibrio lentus]MCB5464214.1 lipopolysaccharide A protein [Vibrio lentus]MCC4792977.1 lipopolysaccharide A protein [Vibrio lentus]MCC4850771.1 lipopolysaccharide A protein [Vibrio lentus]